MKQQPKHPESFKAFLSFLFALIWIELRTFFSRINVKGNIQIDIPDVKQLAPPTKRVASRKVVRVVKGIEHLEATMEKEKSNV